MLSNYLNHINMISFYTMPSTFVTMTCNRLASTTQYNASHRNNNNSNNTTTQYKLDWTKTKSVNGISNFSVCKPGWYHSDGSCLRQCPSGTYAIRDDDESGVFCTACHYSCLSCKGPSDADCVTCHVDSILTWNNGRALCVLSGLTWKMQSTEWFYRMTLVFLINLGLMIVIIIYLVLAWYIRKRKSAHKYSKVSYSGNGKVHADTERLQSENTYTSDSE